MKAVNDLLVLLPPLFLEFCPEHHWEDAPHSLLTASNPTSGARDEFFIMP